MREDKRAYLEELYATRFGGSCRDKQEGTTAPSVLASAPGRIELAGNHTDHQGGQTISAALDQHVSALAVANGTEVIRLFMEGFGEACLQLSELTPRAEEKGRSIALVRGMAAALAQQGRQLYGFDMVTCSDIPIGCGLSSSAAFEILTGAVIRAFCEPDTLRSNVPTLLTAPNDLTTLALQGAWAETVYFGKPCGAQDQLASAFGGINALDFSAEIPHVTPVSFEVGTCSYIPILVDSRSDHSLSIDEYAAIPAQMHAVANLFGVTRLQDLLYGRLLEHLPRVRAQLGDRAALRALHYFEEMQRVKIQIGALQEGDFEGFLKQMRLSGASSALYLQNVSPLSDGEGMQQPTMVILALCAHLLDGGNLPDSPGKGQQRGAYRIHGGGFGGSVLTFVPRKDADSFQAVMDDLLGYDACMPVLLSSRGVLVERLVW